jgi:hypothetical protein
MDHFRPGRKMDTIMTHSEFNQILNSLNGLSPEQMLRLRTELESKMAAARRPTARRGKESLTALNDAHSVETQVQPERELSPQDIQQRLLNAGIVSDIKPPISDPEQYRRRKAVPIQGEPLSETVMRERR